MKVFIYIFAFLLLTGCSSNQKSEGAKAMEQFPVTATPTNKIYPGKVVWHDLLTSDIHKAAQFYQTLFGWQAEFHGPYAVMHFNGKPIAGILKIEAADNQFTDGIWIPSFSVPDVDKAAEQAKANGAKVLSGPLDMKKRGRAALIRDPQQADLVLLRASQGDPIDQKAAIGEWLWDEIWTSKPEQTQQFYQQVMAYDNLLSSDDYDVFMKQNKWRAGVRHLKDDSQPMIWVPVIRVADPQAMLKKVEAADGVVWLDTKEAPGNGNTALISDSTGALLIMQRWPTESSGENK